MDKLIKVVLPDIGEGVVEGEVITWLKAVGDSVARDEPVVVVMTDKATVELPAPAEGVLAAAYYPVGAIARVGTPLYAIKTSVSDTSEIKSVQNAPSESPVVSSPTILPQQQEADIAKEGVKNLALPSTRHLARTLGLSLEQIQGTGSGGRVTPEDIAKHLAHEKREVEKGPAYSPKEDESGEVLSGIRRAMFLKMALSKRTIPHFSYFEKVNATRLIQLRHNITPQAHEEGIHLTYMPFFLKALSQTLTRYPTLNSSIDSETFTVYPHASHHIGIAMSTDGGLIVPIIREVEKKTLAELVHDYELMKQRVIAGSITPQEMRGGTITISNFGVLGGGIWATPIINPPEVAILAIAKITPLPAVHNGQVVVRDMLPLSWSFDHRIIDGSMAAAASHYFAHLLQNPGTLL